jgi:UDP-N-acetylenolpyruvoylglucosamine reductase
MSGDLPTAVERDYPLARLTTVRAGGPAELFARPESAEVLVELLAWAKREGHPVEVIGSGSNLLVADAGVPGLVLKLAGSLAGVERDGVRVVCGGGARLPSASAPGQLGFAYRRSNLGPGEVVARAGFHLSDDDSAGVKARMSSMRDRRREAQPSGIKTFGSTFKNPDEPAAEGRTAGQLLEAAGCQGLQVGGARFSPKHANFVENAGGATTADVLALMAEGCRRVHERFGIALEPEVQVLGDIEPPSGWTLGRGEES